MLRRIIVGICSTAAGMRPEKNASEHRDSVSRMSVQYMLSCSLIVFGALVMPAFAQVEFNIGIEMAPPPARVVVLPAPRPGFIWAPGFWAWEGGSHVWVEGHWVEARPGYYWVPERWEDHWEERGPHWHFAPGRWEHGHGRGERERERERR